MYCPGNNVVQMAAAVTLLAVTMAWSQQGQSEDKHPMNAGVRNIGSTRQLFIDNYMIASMPNLKRN